MKINLERTTKLNSSIDIGDIIRVRENNTEVSYLVCKDDERMFLIDLANSYVLGLYGESDVEEFISNYEMELLEVIQSEQIEIKRI